MKRKEKQNLAIGAAIGAGAALVLSSKKVQRNIKKAVSSGKARLQPAAQKATDKAAKAGTAASNKAQDVKDSAVKKVKSGDKS